MACHVLPRVAAAAATAAATAGHAFLQFALRLASELPAPAAAACFEQLNRIIMYASAPFADTEDSIRVGWTEA